MWNKDNELPFDDLQVLEKGKYVFTSELEEHKIATSPIPLLTAKGFSITETDGPSVGKVIRANISELILRQSVYRDENGKMIEAHRLYTWPSDLGSTPEWTAAKRRFLDQFVLNFPLEILSRDASGGITWRYITPENFKKFPPDLSGSAEFMEFASHSADYFFLRRPVNLPR